MALGATNPREVIVACGAGHYYFHFKNFGARLIITQLLREESMVRNWRKSSVGAGGKGEEKGTAPAELQVALLYVWEI